MKLLILGGTIFLGKHLVQEAIDRGHEVTLFNRGKHNPSLFSKLEKIKGDRDSSLDALKHRSWDAVIDTCGYVPRLVKKAAQILQDQVEHYTFVSTISVYRDFEQVGITEDYPVAKLANERSEKVDNETYGGLKALCEQEVQNYFHNRNLIIRPGLIVGPDDPSDRFTYWPVRIRKSGKIVVPDPPCFPVQIIDVRDLSKFILNQIEKKTNDIIQATGPDYELKFKEILSLSANFSYEPVDFYWLSESFLKQNQVKPFQDLPLWLGSENTFIGLEQISIQKAKSYGITFRPLIETIEDTIAWFETQSRPLRCGLTHQREEELIQNWKP